MTIKAEDSQIAEVIIRGVFVYVVNLNRFAAFATDTAGSIGFKEHLRRDVWWYWGVFSLCHVLSLAQRLQ